MAQQQPKIRKLNEFIIFYDEVIGQGQFGLVVKAQLLSDLLEESKEAGEEQKQQPVVVNHKRSDPTKKIYACKMFDSRGFSEEEMQRVIKEAKMVSLVQSEYTIIHHQTIKTSTKIYMMQEYANCFDLATLIAIRGCIRQ